MNKYFLILMFSVMSINNIYAAQDIIEKANQYFNNASWDVTAHDKGIDYLASKFVKLFKSYDIKILEKNLSKANKLLKFMQEKKLLKEVQTKIPKYRLFAIAYILEYLKQEEESMVYYQKIVDKDYHNDFIRLKLILMYSKKNESKSKTIFIHRISDLDMDDSIYTQYYNKWIEISKKTSQYLLPSEFSKFLVKKYYLKLKAIKSNTNKYYFDYEYSEWSSRILAELIINDYSKALEFLPEILKHISCESFLDSFKRHIITKVDVFLALKFLSEFPEVKKQAFILIHDKISNRLSSKLWDISSENGWRDNTKYLKYFVYFIKKLQLNIKDISGNSILTIIPKSKFITLIDSGYRNNDIRKFCILLNKFALKNKPILYESKLIAEYLALRKKKKNEFNKENYINFYLKIFRNSKIPLEMRLDLYFDNTYFFSPFKEFRIEIFKLVLASSKEIKQLYMTSICKDLIKRDELKFAIKAIDTMWVNSKNNQGYILFMIDLYLEIEDYNIIKVLIKREKLGTIIKSINYLWQKRKGANIPYSLAILDLYLKVGNNNIVEEYLIKPESKLIKKELKLYLMLLRENKLNLFNKYIDVFIDSHSDLQFNTFSKKDMEKIEQNLKALSKEYQFFMDLCITKKLYGREQIDSRFFSYIDDITFENKKIFQICIEILFNAPTNYYREKELFFKKYILKMYKDMAIEKIVRVYRERTFEAYVKYSIFLLENDQEDKFYGICNKLLDLIKTKNHILNSKILSSYILEIYVNKIINSEKYQNFNGDKIIKMGNDLFGELKCDYNDFKDFFFVYISLLSVKNKEKIIHLIKNNKANKSEYFPSNPVNRMCFFERDKSYKVIDLVIIYAKKNNKNIFSVVSSYLKSEWLNTFFDKAKSNLFFHGKDRLPFFMKDVLQTTKYEFKDSADYPKYLLLKKELLDNIIKEKKEEF